MKRMSLAALCLIVLLAGCKGEEKPFVSLATPKDTIHTYLSALSRSGPDAVQTAVNCFSPKADQAYVASLKKFLTSADKLIDAAAGVLTRERANKLQGKIDPLASQGSQWTSADEKITGNTAIVTAGNGQYFRLENEAGSWKILEQGTIEKSTNELGAAISQPMPVMIDKATALFNQLADYYDKLSADVAAGKFTNGVDKDEAVKNIRKDMTDHLGQIADSLNMSPATRP